MKCYQCKKNSPVVGKKACQVCLDWQANYRRQNRQRRIATNSRWRKSNVIAISTRRRELYDANKEKERRRASAYRQAVKLEVFSHYCGKTIECELCDEARIGALTVDHIEGGGTAHRRSISKIYFWLRKNSYPTGYRVLCSNCNWRQHLLRTTQKRSETNIAIKKRFMTVLGGKCRECGETDLNVLSVHHSAENGAGHRREVSGGRSGVWFYKAILKSGDFTGLECLCMSCNDAREWGVGIQTLSDDTTAIHLPI